MFIAIVIVSVAGLSQIPFVWSTKYRRPINVSALIMSVFAFFVLMPLWLIESLNSVVAFSIKYL